MKQLKRLTVVSERYPVPGEPVFPFVDALLVALDSLGVEIRVVSPQSVTRVLLRGGARTPATWKRETARGGFWVRQPRYLTVSGLSRAFNRRCYRSAVRRGIASLDFEPDAYYAHFWHSGIAAALAARDAKPVFVACGESRVDPGFASDVSRVAGKLGGVISVSGKNKADCVNLFGLAPEFIDVLPNGVDTGLFRPTPARDAKRAALGLAAGDFTVAFVGWFDERKGVKRLEAALRGLAGVKVIYIGSGDLTPTGDNIAFCDRVEHALLPEFLSAADVFVLPTRAEGCCNAIVEAMACGLPVISSTGAFNDDLLSPDNAIRIDPDDVGAIRDAVVTLRDDRALAQQMGANAYAFASGLTVTRRAERIKAFIEARL